MLVVYSLLLFFWFFFFWSNAISIVNEFTTCTFHNDLTTRKFCVLDVTFLKVFKTKKSGNGSSIRYDSNNTL